MANIVPEMSNKSKPRDWDAREQRERRRGWDAVQALIQALEALMASMAIKGIRDSASELLGRETSLYEI